MSGRARSTSPPGNWEYKAALNDTWDVNYGANAQLNGPNIGLSLASPTAVKFYYDHATHWITDNHNAVIATAPGSYQSEFGLSRRLAAGLPALVARGSGRRRDLSVLHRCDPARRLRGQGRDQRELGRELRRRRRPERREHPVHRAAGGMPVVFSYDSQSHVLTISQGRSADVNLRREKAHWLTRDTLVWDPGSVGPGATYHLHYATRRRAHRGRKRHHRGRDDRPHAGGAEPGAEDEVPTPGRSPRVRYRLVRPRARSRCAAGPVRRVGRRC